MEDIIAITFIFGGGTLFLLSISPVGRAIADRIRGVRTQHDDRALDELRDAIDQVSDENRQLREDLTEVQERLEFAERLLVTERDKPPQLPPA